MNILHRKNKTLLSKSQFENNMTSSIQDLGVIVDNRLTFKDHITSIVTRAHVRAMEIWRCFLCKDMDVVMRAFITYVHPLLEYCSPVWSPSSNTLIDQLESVQWRFTKRSAWFTIRHIC